MFDHALKRVDEDLPGGRVVVDDEDPQGLESAGNGCPTAKPLSDLDPGRERERTADADLAIEPDLPAHQLNQAAADRQPQTGATVLPSRGCVCLREGLEQLRGLLARQADTGVPDRELQLHLVAGPFDLLD